MNPQIINSIYISTSILALIGIAEYLFHFRKIEAEKTRKLVHLGSGLITMTFPLLFDHFGYVFALSGAFWLILQGSLWLNVLPSINKIDRVSQGSVLYPLVVGGCFYAASWANSDLFFYLPILILAVCDPIACLIGRRFPLRKFSVGQTQKSWGGSSAFFFFAFLLSYFFLCSEVDFGYYHSAFWIAILVALATTFAEAISGKGYDNLTIPMAALAILYSLKEQPKIYAWAHFVL